MHSNVITVHRCATSECHDAEDSNAHTLSDAVFLNVYDLPPPYSMVRFSRLRMSIRMMLRSPFGLLALVHFALPDARSWLRALLADLQ